MGLAGAETKPDRDTIDRIKYETMEKFRHDADIAIVQFCMKVLKLILLPPFEALVHPAAKLIIEPLASMVCVVYKSACTYTHGGL